MIRITHFQGKRNLLDILYHQDELYRFKIDMNNSFIVKATRMLNDNYTVEIHTSNNSLNITTTLVPMNDFLNKLSDELLNYYTDHSREDDEEYSFFYQEEGAVIYFNVTSGVVGFIRGDDLVKLSHTEIETINFKVRFNNNMPRVLHLELKGAMIYSYENPPVEFTENFVEADTSHSGPFSMNKNY